MADISKITLLNGTTYDLKDSSAIANITRSGTTFTATRRDGTTFTFTQQDNNTWTTVSTSAAGIVPALPTSSPTEKYLRGDGTWATVEAGGGGSTISSWDPGTLPSLSSSYNTRYSITDVGEMTSASVSGSTLTITNGSAPTRSSFSDYTYTLSKGTLPSLSYS